MLLYGCAFRVGEPLESEDVIQHRAQTKLMTGKLANSLRCKCDDNNRGKNDDLPRLGRLRP